MGEIQQLRSNPPKPMTQTYTRSVPQDLEEEDLTEDEEEQGTGWNKEKKVSGLIRVATENEIRDEDDMIIPYTHQVKETPKIPMMQNTSAIMESPVMTPKPSVNVISTERKPSDDFVYGMPQDDEDF